LIHFRTDVAQIFGATAQTGNRHDAQTLIKLPLFGGEPSPVCSDTKRCRVNSSSIPSPEFQRLNSIA
jgi:hypothetical protein